MSKKNTTPEVYDETSIEETMPQEEILMNENDLLAGLLELGKSKDETSSYHKIQIKRNGVVKLEFRIRPLTEDETQVCLKEATRYAPKKPNQPKKAIETNNVKFRSLMIYTATIDKDREKIWDNETAKRAFDIFEGWEMIDRVLLAGEKDRVLDKIDEISGYNEDLEETAGN